jgi:H+/Cl- antiporter ClcA
MQSQPNLIDAAPVSSFGPRFWLIVLLTGAIVGLIGGLLMRLLFFVEHFAWHSGPQLEFLDAVMAASPGRRVINLAIAGLIVGTVGVFFQNRFGKKGSDVEGAIWFDHGNVAPMATFCKAVLSIVHVGLGTSLGRESPIKQAGGAVAAVFSRMGKLSPSQQQLLVAAGVGAGMAAAYNVPLGGGLFAAEVLVGSISLRNVMPLMATSVIATAASWLLLPAVPIYSLPEFHLSFSTVAWAIVAGPIFGFTAVLIVRGVALAAAPRRGRGWSMLMPIVVITALGLLSIRYPQLLGNGKDTVQFAFDNRFEISLLLALPLLKWIATVGCLFSGARGGLFTPTMTIGALLGGAMGHAWLHVQPGQAPGSFAVIGACAVLAAATRGPVSSLVLVLELTRHADVMMVPMLLASALAIMVAGRFESRSIYSARATVAR